MNEEYKQENRRLRIEKTIRNLQKNNMQAFYSESRYGVAAIISSLLQQGEVVVLGDSDTLLECEIDKLLYQGDYQLLDSHQPGLTRPEIVNIYRQSLLADTFLCSSNAVTENGELYNVDGNSNRVAALCFGPDSVIIVVGYNKIVPDVSSAIMRVRKVAAPINAHRHGRKLYCAMKGECIACSNPAKIGCDSEGRICSNYVLSSRQKIKNRIKVIIVGEELGF